MSFCWCSVQNKMASISLKINVVDSSMVKTIMFDPTTTIYDACRMIRDRLAEPINNCMHFLHLTPPSFFERYLPRALWSCAVWMQKRVSAVNSTSDILFFLQNVPLFSGIRDNWPSSVLLDLFLAANHSFALEPWGKAWNTSVPRTCSYWATLLCIA